MIHLQVYFFLFFLCVGIADASEDSEVVFSYEADDILGIKSSPVALNEGSTFAISKSPSGAFEMGEFIEEEQQGYSPEDLNSELAEYGITDSPGLFKVIRTYPQCLSPEKLAEHKALLKDVREQRERQAKKQADKAQEKKRLSFSLDLRRVSPGRSTSPRKSERSKSLTSPSRGGHLKPSPKNASQKLDMKLTPKDLEAE